MGIVSHVPVEELPTHTFSNTRHSTKSRVHAKKCGMGCVGTHPPKKRSFGCKNFWTTRLLPTGASEICAKCANTQTRPKCGIASCCTLLHTPVCHQSVAHLFAPEKLTSLQFQNRGDLVSSRLPPLCCSQCWLSRQVLLGH